VWVRQLAAELRSLGYPVEDLLAQAGLTDSDLGTDSARIPFAKHAAFFELAAEVTGDDCFGLHFAQTREIPDAGIVGYVGLSSPTLSDAYKNISRYVRVASDATVLSTDMLDADGALRWWVTELPSPKPRQCLEFTGAQIVRGMRDLTGRSLVPVSVSFAHPRTEHIEEFENCFRCPVRFGREENVVQIKLSDLQIPLAASDDRLLTVLRGLCEDALSRRGHRPLSLVEKVEHTIADRLAKGEAKLDIAASELGMSPRSLSRRLAESGTSFNRIVEDLRQKLATRYLGESGLRLAEISFLLGYTDVSSFNHAFKRWTGKTPSAFRREAS
jgi:AraC-like DNA-binding protein